MIDGSFLMPKMEWGAKQTTVARAVATIAHRREMLSGAMSFLGRCVPLEPT